MCSLDLSSHPQANVLAQSLLGASLARLRKQLPCQRLSPFTALCVLLQTLDALRGAHELGLLHRDIKPANMCVGLSRDTLPTDDPDATATLSAALDCK